MYKSFTQGSKRVRVLCTAKRRWHQISRSIQVLRCITYSNNDFPTTPTNMYDYLVKLSMYECMVCTRVDDMTIYCDNRARALRFELCGRLGG